MSGARSAFNATAKTVPLAVRGGVMITTTLVAGVTWLATRGLPPVYRLGSEILRRPIDLAFRILIASLLFLRDAYLHSGLLRWTTLPLVGLSWFLWSQGHAGVVIASIAFVLALGAVLGLSMERRAHRAERQSHGTG